MRAGGPQILAGDFNFWGPPVGVVMRGWKRPVRGRTYPARRPHSQIDHVLVRGGIEVLGGEVLAETPSDHRPIRARLRLPERSNVNPCPRRQTRVPRASGEATIVRPRITARERLARIIQRRELLVGMVRNELKIKYKNSVLGFAWSLLNPLLYLVVFYIAFTIILGSGIPAFPIWLLSGLLVWNLFSTGLGAATGSVVANSGSGQEGVVPARDPSARRGRQHARALLPAELRCCSSCSRSCAGMLRGAYIPLLPVALVVLLLLTSALGILLSAINVYLRDTSHFLELALLAWFWVTPIVYPFELVAQRGPVGRSASWMANPVTPIVLIFQRAIYARLDNPHPKGGGPPVQLLPHWPYWGYVAYLGYSLAFALIVTGDRDPGVRSLGGELRGGALRWRPRSRSAASRSSSSCTTSTTRR